ncbi:uncharacterized protein KQ657_000958 [Scheffersomyces spartinae]|uniref:GPI transamidase component GAB1 n=1 Tax=Scheffersomyces spartinae TaxID=45513 RepID=A0A9P8AHV8_9ASCO|nr:uncharacterized protein KQ657_000958 [Scheffersomyces spartinae]KAG7193198.1 hypothetical protein KQ657_000958 [Scheffersomyces spartinae]
MGTKASLLPTVLVVGGLIRLLPLLFPLIPYQLSSVVEISTPINSYKSLQEAFYYLKHGINLYDGGINHHPPLLVVLLSYVPNFSIFYALVDVYISYSLVKLHRWYQEHNSIREKQQLVGLGDNLIAAFYLFNPLILLTCYSGSTLPLSFLFIVEALVQACIQQKGPRAVMMLSIAAYISYNPAFLIFPLLGLIHVSARKAAVNLKTPWNPIQEYIESSGIYIASLSLLFLCSFAVTAGTQFVDQCYWTVISLSKISPNIGLWWYLFTEMFEFFRTFYIGIFNIYGFIFLIPITWRLFERKDPSNIATGDSFLAFVLCFTWINYSKSYPVVGDLAQALLFLPFFYTTSLPHTRFVFVPFLVFFVALILAPIFYYCWIVLGNGNSNFFYSLNLVWGIGYALLLTNVLWGRLVKNYLNTNKVTPEKHSLIRLTQM